MPAWGAAARRGGAALGIAIVARAGMALGERMRVSAQALPPSDEELIGAINAALLENDPRLQIGPARFDEEEYGGGVWTWTVKRAGASLEIWAYAYNDMRFEYVDASGERHAGGETFVLPRHGDPIGAKAVATAVVAILGLMAEDPTVLTRTGVATPIGGIRFVGLGRG